MGERPLIIGIDARLRTGEVGGVEQFVTGLAFGLSQLSDGQERYLFLVEPGEDAWLRPYVGGPCELISRLDAGGAPSRRVALMKRRLTRAMPWLRQVRHRFLRSNGAGIAIPQSDLTLENAGAQVIHFPFQAAFMTSVPSIYQPWDLQHLHLPEFFTADAIDDRERLYRAFCEQAELVVVASDWAKRDLAHRYGLSPAKIAVVPVPPPIAAYPEPTVDQLRAVKLRRALPDTFAYYPAQTWRHKNHIRLLQSLALARDQLGVTIDLVCSGRTNEHFSEIEREAKRLDLSDNVRFLGFVTPLEVRALYRLSRMLIFPSLFEGWGLPVVEAFAAGIPVACASVTSLPDLVGDAAVMFDPRDPDDIARAIHRIWTDDGLRQTLVARGATRVSALDWPDCAAKYRDYYRAIARRHRSAPLYDPTQEAASVEARSSAAD